MPNQTMSREARALVCGPLLLAKRTFAEPKQVCSIFPSSAAVGRHLVKAVADRPNPYIVELGAGTGAVTGEILTAGTAPRHLTVVEMDDELVEHLHKRFKGLKILHSRAETIAKHWRTENLANVGAIISTLPMRLFNEQETRAVMQSSFDILAEGGVFTQITYRWRSPVMPSILRDMEITGKRRSVAVANLPPAFIWVYQAVKK